MNKLALSILLLFATLSWAVASNPDRKKDEEEVPVITEGILYALPRTGIKITVTAKQERFVHGPYHKFAKRFLGIENAKSANYTKWSITGVDMSSFSEPDPQRVFKAMGIVASRLSLTPSGILAGINNNVAAVNIENTTSELFPTTEEFVVPHPDLTLNDYFKEINDSVNGLLLKDRPIEEKAYDVAHLITKLRKRRFHIMSANYEVLPPDGKAYEVLVKELARLEKSYVELFTGKTYTNERTVSFDFMPTTTGKGEVVFRFSPEKGIVAASDLSGSPMSINVKPITALVNSQKKRIGTNGTHESGVFYCNPVVANIELTSGSQVIAKARMSLAQIGTIAPFPEAMLNGAYSVEFHPMTGALKNVSKAVTVAP